MIRPVCAYRAQTQRSFFVPMLEQGNKKLFDFSFFVNNVLTNNRIKFFDLHFFGHSTLVFCGCIKVTRAFGRNQFNFIAHFSILLYVNASFTQIDKNGIDAILVDNTHCFCGNSEAYPAVFAFYPKSMVLQIWTKASFSSVICV
jgi:hypothetical protein